LRLVNVTLPGSPPHHRRIQVTVAAAGFSGIGRARGRDGDVCELEIEAGAVYRPDALMLPTTGLIDHVTAVLLVPVTVAEKVWV